MSPSTAIDQHLYMGTVYPHEFPEFLIHRDILEGHAYVHGGTGTGKTSRLIVPTLMQVARPTASGELSPIVILDLKGDPVLFSTAVVEAQRRGQKLRYFTLEPSKDTYWFNPLQALNAMKMTIPQIAETIIQGLGLNRGDFYGAAFYAGQNRYFLTKVLLSLANRPESIREIFEIVLQQQGKHRDAGELVSTLHALSMCEPLGSQKEAPAGTQFIHFPDILKNGEMVYFSLPSIAVGDMAAREVGKLALYLLLNATRDAGRDRPRTYLFIDEFQRIASQHLDTILQMARSYGTSLILSSQNLANLDAEPGASNISTALLQLPLIVSMAPSTDDMFRRVMIERSGEVIEHLPMRTVGEHLSDHGDLGYSIENDTRWYPERRPRLTVDDCREITVADNQCLIAVSRDIGLTQTHGIPTRVVLPEAMPPAVYAERCKDWWPDAPPKQATGGGAQAKPKSKVLQKGLEEVLAELRRRMNAHTGGVS